MKASSKKEINYIPLPKDSRNLIGHDKSLGIFSEAIASNKLPQSWIISGEKGIGKATFAYNIARILLAGDSEINTFNRISNGSHSDLMVVEPDLEKAAGDIKVDEIRKISGFLRLTVSETARRVVIIDSADDMNVNAANALLKLLEEPPENAIFLLISHTPGKLLPTIKSRCRKMALSPLDTSDAVDVLKLSDPEISENDASALIKVAGGSPGMALDLYANDGMKIHSKIIEIFNTLPDLSQVQVLAGMIVKKGDNKPWEIMVYLLEKIISDIIRRQAGISDFSEAVNIKNQLIVEKDLEDLIKIWEKVNSLLCDTDRIFLDKRAVLGSIFGEFV